ncbi:MAG: L-2-hydroxyglutarate oxidase [Halobacterium sp.]
MEHDVVVVGGGCVGVSTAYHVASRTALDVAVVEKEHHLAAHQSGRNSGVLHPGFNYEPGTRKAEFAVEGTRRMKEFCGEHGVPCEEVGVVVAARTREEERRLDELAAQADANGVDATVVDRDRLRELEPEAAGRAALHCPAAASVDAQQYVYALAGEARDAGVTFHVDTEVTGLDRASGGYDVRTDSGTLEAGVVVNAAGLHADRLAHSVGVGEDYRVVPFRGEYYEVRPDRRGLVNSMIYPTPDPELPFLGVHFTRRADGSVIVGPNAVLAFGREAYENTAVDLRDLRDALGYEGFWRLFASPKMLRVGAAELGKSFSKRRFAAAARELLPALRAADLVPSYAGVRAQVVSRDGDLVKEPLFVEDRNAVHVLNAVSPGLTCSLPFGDHLADRVEAMA